MRLILFTGLFLHVKVALRLSRTLTSLAKKRPLSLTCTAVRYSDNGITIFEIQTSCDAENFEISLAD